MIIARVIARKIGTDMEILKQICSDCCETKSYRWEININNTLYCAYHAEIIKFNLNIGVKQFCIAIQKSKCRNGAIKQWGWDGKAYRGGSRNGAVHFGHHAHGDLSAIKLGPYLPKHIERANDVCYSYDES